MTMKNKQLFTALALSLAASSFAHATSDNAQIRNLENRVSALEQRKGASGMINPSGRPQVRGGADLFVYGDFLWWQAYENGLPLVTKNNSTAGTLNNAEVKTLSSDWAPGFRVGIGYNMPHDGWDLSLTWLRLYTKGHKKVTAGFGQELYPYWDAPSGPAGGSTCTTARGTWKMHLNQLDLDLGREFFVSKWLTMRPHFGLRAAWVRQKLYGRYSNLSVPAGDELEFQTKLRSWGLGIEGGLNTRWGLGSGFSLYGDLNAAILYGFQKAHPKEDIEQTSNKYLNAVRSYRVSNPILDLALGLRWDHMFSRDRWHVGLRAGWEHHIYFNQNQTMIFVDDVSPGTFVANQGDLSLQGWTFGARFDF